MSTLLTRAVRYGGLQILLGHDALVDESAVFGRLRLPRGAVLVVKRDSQDAADLLRSILVLRREHRPMAFVDQLQHAEEVLLEEDRDGEDGLRAEARLFVPALIEAKIRVQLQQLVRVVRVADVDPSSGSALRSPRSTRTTSERGSPSAHRRLSAASTTPGSSCRPRKSSAAQRREARGCDL